MTSRITVTQKGRQLQKELNNQNKFELPPLLSTSSKFFEQTRGSDSPMRSCPTLEDRSFHNEYTDFNSTAYNRSGYFGPKKDPNSAEKGAAQHRPYYYPNYLRKSYEDYPSSHFKVLTPQHALRHIDSNNPALQRLSNGLSSSAELVTSRRLPVKYVHHTIFPYTRPDKPSFAKFHMENRSPEFNNTNCSVSNTSRNGANIGVYDDFMEEQTVDTKRGDCRAQRQNDLQKTLYLDKTVITDHYSGKIIDKYDDRRLNRMIDKHLETQRNFTKTLDSIEEKYQKKAVKYEENMNEAPDFIREMKSKEEIMENVKKMKSNEDVRYHRRLNNLHEKKYKEFWTQHKFADVRAKRPPGVTKIPTNLLNNHANNNSKSKIHDFQLTTTSSRGDNDMPLHIIPTTLL